jgi:hypothetical protein
MRAMSNRIGPRAEQVRRKADPKEFQQCSNPGPPVGKSSALESTVDPPIRHHLSSGPPQILNSIYSFLKSTILWL